MKTRLFLPLLLVMALDVHQLNAATAFVSDDASTTSVKPGLKRGSSVSLAVGSRETSFIKFDLSALPSGLTTNQVAKATLRLWVERVGDAGSIKVYPVESDWSELTIQHTDAPTVSSTESATLNLAAGRKKFYVSVDVTTLVAEWITGQRNNYGLALKPGTNAASAQFDSKENAATSHEPVLEIVLAGPKGDQGIQGEKGDEGEDGEPGEQGPPGPTTPLPTGSTLMIGRNDTAPEGYVDSGLRSADWSVDIIADAPAMNFPSAKVLVSLNRLFLGKSNGSIQEFNYETNEWSQSETQITLVADPRWSVDSNGIIYCFSGDKSVRTFNPSTGATAQLQNMPDMPNGIPLHVLFLNNHFYFIAANDSWDFNVNTQQWVTFPLTLGSNNPGSRSLSWAIANGGAIFANTLDGMQKIIPGQTPWVILRPEVISLIPVSMSESEFLLIGADRNGSVIRYNDIDQTLTYEAKPSGEIFSRPFMDAVSFNGEILVFNGNEVGRAPIASFRRLLIKQ